ncbi:DsbA family oxidoreductase [Ponticoccus sp. SC2-23]|uniref:DsbA family oxidoreductase n=1 Tax=Alexandriicola marinus TaxID=2081710 RepID=UPI000FD7C1B1|nr:DsbA family oxidoreductase [Alexandriicola marinus]MBM1218877.1 DsbA family oxidoreductase [Ponticoccus sp. SC6-9]MBM1224051.1 DsbA family oxidoreductase [Ponticoccus sp. SC6-15]MBM1230170.1 DsbA family oxidoreductase [Ponticoccus sp. SC6-38]MBM1233017.1 DsbA family oxidoreductase [Ponticoccus sp. SC6-45]MBM1237033.1 DsbA family oxidoreductase [Ponticoccus sp. SC6-49]MBM1242028.1 DsbA family oxidoreductase [Ponticoccus sp. SC2-64]MBM1246541.1 DsbA family oxidoreductase [Ponticoccus sp. SC
MVKLDILSDPICPWCYIGKARLDAALKARPDHPFVIEWHPFQLNPDMPPEGMDRRSYLEAKFGGKEQAVSVYARIAEEAEASGLFVNLASIDRTPNTVNAHRLIHWAGIERKQEAAVTALFNAYFTEGRDIGDSKVLCDIAEAIGMERDVVERLLSSDAEIEDIKARDAHSRQMGVNAVPTFIVAQQHVVPGAQPAEFWEKVIDDIIEQLPDPG